MGFVTEKPIKSIRKPRRCDACNVMVNAGESAIGWAGVTDGEFQASIYHPECRTAEIALNKVHETSWDPDDWLGISRDLEFDDHAWLLAEHPIVAARLSITAESIRIEEEDRESTRKAWAEIDAKRLRNRTQEHTPC